MKTFTLMLLLFACLNIYADTFQKVVCSVTNSSGQVLIKKTLKNGDSDPINSLPLMFVFNNPMGPSDVWYYTLSSGRFLDGHLYVWVSKVHTTEDAGKYIKETIGTIKKNISSADSIITSMDEDDLELTCTPYMD